LDPRAPLVDRLKGMEGLRVGVANEPPRRLRVLFAKAGMNVDRDIQMMIIPAERQIAAYKSGEVDALYTHSPFLAEALIDLGAFLMASHAPGEIAELANGQIHPLGATRQYADAHPEVLLAMTRAIARAQDLLHADPAAAAQALTRAGIKTPGARHLAA